VSFDCEGLSTSRLSRRRGPHNSQNAIKDSWSASTLENPRTEAAAGRTPNCAARPEMGPRSEEAPRPRPFLGLLGIGRKVLPALGLANGDDVSGNPGASPRPQERC